MTEREERYAKAIALLDEWMRDESGYDERAYPLIEAALRGQEEPMDQEMVTVSREWLASIADCLKELGATLTARDVRAALSPPKPCEHPADKCVTNLVGQHAALFKCFECGATAPAVPGEWSGP